MTCDDDALLKDNAIQKEMKFTIKPIFKSFEAILKNFVKTIDMKETCFQMSSIYSSIYKKWNKSGRISNYNF
jgi:hypothetical protein